MNTLQITYPPELQREFDLVNRKLDQIQKTMQPKQPDEFMTRQQVAELLHIDLSSVHNLTVRGTLKKYQLGGGRVYYKRSEVESAIKAI